MKRWKMFVATLVFVMAALGVFAACGSSDVQLSFETNGGPAVEAVTVTKGETYELPAPDAWTGYEFDGWYADSACSVGPVAEVTAEEDATFYAKWTKLAAITLDLDGGTLAAGTTLYARAGENLRAFMQNYVPTKDADHLFGEWTVNGQPLSPTATVQDGLTLKARYQVAYTVRTHLQDLSEEGEGLSTYTHSEQTDIVLYEYAGTVCTPDPSVQGFHVVTHDGDKRTGTISENASENVFDLYFDRSTFTVTFISQSPAPESTTTVSGLYGAKKELPDDPTAEGWMFRGWRELGASEMAYVAEPETFGGAAAPQEHTFTVEETAQFYAVWSQGYTDMFGGDDVVFVPEDLDGVAYLLRADKMFKGTASGDAFTFGDTQGRIYRNSTQYVYNDDSRNGFTCYQYIVGFGVDPQIRVILDGYNGITYSDRSSGTDEKSTGTYTMDDEGQLVTRFTDGALAGQDRVIRIGNVNTGSYTQSVFRVRGEELDWGTMQYAKIGDNGITADAEYTLALDGFGSAVLTRNGATASYYYANIRGTILVFNNSGSILGYVIHLSVSGDQLFSFFDPEMSNTYTAADGASLILDGCMQAAYRENEDAETVAGLYTLTECARGQIVHFRYRNGQEWAHKYFLVYAQTVSSGDGSETATDYILEEKPEGYNAYYYSESRSAYYAPMIVFDDSAATVGKITVYGYNTSTGEYIPLLLGNYTGPDETTGLYTFTTEEHYPYEGTVSVGGYDYSTIETIRFALGTFTYSDGTAFPVSFWYAVKNTDAAETVRGTEYTDTNGKGASLRLIGSYAFYEDEAGWAIGQYSQSGTLLRFTDGAETYYFELDDTGKKYTELDGVIGTVALFDITSGNATNSETLAFDGKGGAKYTYTDGSKTTLAGTYSTVDGEELDGRPVMQFTVQDDAAHSFKFVLMILPNGMACFCKYEEGCGGTFTEYGTASGATLVLDGYGYRGTYTPASGAGDPVTGAYTFDPEEKVVILSAGTVTMRFILAPHDDKTFRLCGEEYGDYAVFENNIASGVIFHFDGLGETVRVYEFDDAGEPKDIDPNGTYERSGDAWKVTYHSGTDTIEMTGALGSMSNGNYMINAFFATETYAVGTYVDLSDWSVIEFDSFGSATKHASNGVVWEGAYVLITNDLMYYSDGSGTGDCLYRYDRTEGTLEKISTAYTDRGYYTEELDALLFNASGYMVAGGDALYYYEILQGGKVRLYYHDEAAAGKNEYGFVTDETIPSLPIIGEVEFKGETYRSNGGFNIQFNRAAGDTDFPIPYMKDGVPTTAHFKRIIFTPSGGNEFSLNASVILSVGGEDGEEVTFSAKEGYYVNIMRVMEDDTAAMYLRIAATVGGLPGMYVLKITVHYAGNNTASAANSSTFTVDSMRTEATLVSSLYQSSYYEYYMLYGQTIENTYGEIMIVTDYDEEGTAGTPRIIAEFGEDTELNDSLGAPLAIADCEVHVVTTGSIPYFYVDVTGTDGKDYRVRFEVDATYYSILGVPGYLFTLSRLESLSDNGYTVIAERVLSSETTRKAGTVLSLAIEQDGKPLTFNRILVNGNKFYCAVNTAESGVVTAIKYYIAEFTLAEEVGDVLPEYVSVTVTVKDAVRYMGSIPDSYVDLAGDEVVLLCYNGALAIATSTEKQSGDLGEAYLVTVSGATFMVTILNGTAVITPQQAS